MNREKGMTLIEIMVALAIFTVVIGITFNAISTFWKGFTGIDATHQLKSYGQKAVNKLQLRLSECKRIFQNDAAGSAFLSRLTGIEPLLSNSKISSIEETGSLNPTDSSFVSSSVGNSLLFTNTEYPEILELSSTNTVRIDKYIFNYYYLSPNTRYTIGDTPAIRLMEWHSQQYADYLQIDAITDPNTKSLVVIALRNNGIEYAWNPTGSDPTSDAFHSLNADGTMILQGAGFWIGKDASGQDTYTQKEMTRFARGTLGGKYRAGVSPNTGGSFNPGKTVPVYAAADGKFPGGFEVIIIGPRSAHRAFIRLVLVAEGHNLQLAIENSVLISTRNLW